MRGGGGDEGVSAHAPTTRVSPQAVRTWQGPNSGLRGNWYRSGFLPNKVKFINATFSGSSMRLWRDFSSETRRDRNADNSFFTLRIFSWRRGRGRRTRYADEAKAWGRGGMVEWRASYLHGEGQEHGDGGGGVEVQQRVLGLLVDGAELLAVQRAHSRQNRLARGGGCAAGNAVSARSVGGGKTGAHEGGRQGPRRGPNRGWHLDGGDFKVVVGVGHLVVGPLGQRRVAIGGRAFGQPPGAAARRSGSACLTVTREHMKGGGGK